MRSFRLLPLATALLVLTLPGLTGCAAVFFQGAAVVTAPMDKKGTFKEIQAAYTANIRYGMYDKALVYVEPELRESFKAMQHRYNEIRFTDYVIERVDINSGSTEARAVVRYEGYWLSSPFQQEIEVVQQWRRAAPSQTWFVTPELDELVTPTPGG